MAENTLCRNAALPYPVYGVPWAMNVPLLDADGDPTASGADLDCEISKNGDTAADIDGTESDVGGGNYLLTFTAADMTANIVAGTLKTSTSGLKATNFTLYPRRLPVIASGTCQGGDTTYATLAAGTILFDNQFVGCLLVVNIDSTKQARIITSSTASNQQATVGDAFTVAPDSDDTYEIMVPEGAGIPSVDAKYVSGNATAADNLESACANYSATRGLAGTALPAAAADAAGGLPISDAGGLDLDAKLANTNEVTAARMGALTDWINGGRLDLILDAILADTGTDGVVVAAGSKTGYALTAAYDAAKTAASQASVDTVDGIVAAILADTGTDGVVVATGSKTGYALSATGLDLIVKMKALMDGTPSGSVVDDNDPDPSATAFETDLAETADDYYGDVNGASYLLFTSGTNAGQSRKISAYDGTTKVITVAAAFDAAPAAGDDFLIIGRSG